MDKLKKLYAKKEQLVKDMRAILTACDTESRDFTPEEEEKYAGFDKELDSVNKMIKMEERMYQVEMEMDISKRKIDLPNVEDKGEDEKVGEFRNTAEFIYTMIYRPNDERLAELRTQQMKEGSAGGIFVPNKLATSIFSVSPQTAIVRPRANVIPAGDPPDATMTFPYLDQGTNMYGGVTVSWIQEGGAKPATEIKWKEFSLTPYEVAAYIPVTDKLLRNWSAASSEIESKLRAAVIGEEDTQFLTGNGVGKPKGVLNSKCAITVNRTTANQIVRADIDSMYAKIWEDGGQYVWLASPTCKPYLMAIADAGSNNLWMGNYASGLPPTLLGAPVIWSQRNVGLGTKGDLMLVNLKYYYIKDGSGPFVEASPHVYFTSNKTVIKIYWNVDGRAALENPIAIEGSKSNTLSPFVILN